MSKPSLAIHKLTSCSGCQAVILNLGEDLLTLSQLLEIRHFVEGGLCNPDAQVDIAIVEGSISTPEDEERIRRVRDQSRLLIAVGACACSGGVQALRNVKASADWAAATYERPEAFATLPQSSPVSALVDVDLMLWGCPINGRQLLAAVRSLLLGAKPVLPSEKVCQECKRAGHICVLVTQDAPCLGPVTRAGCGALCPGSGAPCYTCFGPAEQPNCAALARQLQSRGLPARQVAERFVSISAGAAPFQSLWRQWQIPVREEKS